MKRLDPEVRAKLRFVEIADGEEPDMSLFPDFMLIGPQRTGTSWIHKNFVKHPQISMPEQKELYYFNTLRSDEFHPKDLPPVSRSLTWYLRFFEETGEQIEERDTECRELFGEPYRPEVRGEATATYAAGMDREVIQEVLLLNPAMKAIVMIRNPIDRAWSHAKKDLSKNVGRPLETVEDAEFEEFFGRWYQRQCGRYTQIIDLWTPLLREGHLFIGEFDDIHRSPDTLLRRLFDFVGVRSCARYVTADLAHRRVNPTQQAPIPERFRTILAGLFEDELQKLAAHGLEWE